MVEDPFRTDGTDREKRWMLLSQDGRHSWLGRHSDPTEDELREIAVRLQAIGLGGWLAIAEGDYWMDGAYSVLEVRRLSEGGDFAEARERFIVLRREVLARA